ncbi:head GIN domain-containing protein [Flavobacterium sp.]|uniref:head GIN domain-containing protein n=1 Tax=Flavobacterium sp. TaxID=239 RepID=UPI0037509802
MIKFIVFCTKAIVVTVIALLFSSCNQSINFGDGLDGNGNVQSEKRTVTEKFTKVEANRGLEVIVEKADVVAIEVEADSNLLKHITTVVENGTLIISTDESIDSAEQLTVTVKMPLIEGLIATSGSTLRSKNTLKGTSIELESNSGSEIEASLEYENIAVETTSGSTTTLSGKALKLNTETTSGSQLNAETLEANEVISEATSGSSTDIHPLVTLNATASSGSDIQYSGTPKNITKEENSGGSISAN